MRVAALPLLVLPLLLAQCGAKQDLIIGEILLRGGADAAGASGGSGSGGADANGGTTPTAGAGGSNSSGVGGGNEAGGTDSAGSTGVAGEAGSSGDAGAAGMASVPEDDCVAGSEPPLGSLRHRYTFDGAGTAVVDSGVAMGVDAELVGTTLDGSGTVKMSGTGPQFVDLPDGIASELTDMTVVAWTTWTGEAAWPRVFDFGISTQGLGVGAGGRSYIAVMPKTGFQNQAKPGLGAEIQTPGFPTLRLASTEAMKNRMAQVGFVFRSGVSASLYLDGAKLASQPTTISLSNIDDRNNWIGQSQYRDNPAYAGTFEEFRIYDVALDSCQLHTLLVRGPQTP